MTAYHGGKQRIGKEIANVIVQESLSISDDENFTIKGYCEPFCGMLGVYKHIPELFEDEELKLKYKAGDINKSVIMMWIAAQQGWTPPTSITEKKYLKLKNGNDSAEKGFVGHQYSYGGEFFKAFCKKYGKISDFPKAVQNVKNIAKKLEDVKFSYGSYKQYSKLKNHIIYCDPPYNNSKQDYVSEFNSENFYNWCRKMSENNIIFISEYSAPKDFTKIWSKTTKLTGKNIKKKHNKNHIKRIEKLFVI